MSVCGGYPNGLRGYKDDAAAGQRAEGRGELPEMVFCCVEIFKK